jgi:threonine dehydrogenase-like Zn-dependent dehydrogenase
VNFDDVDVRPILLELAGGRGPDKCIDAVGLEARHGAAHIQLYDRVKQAVRSETDRPHALRQAILACRSGGIVSVIGVYGGFVDKFPAGAWMNRSITLRTGQCHVHRYMRPLLQRIERGELNPARVITHRLPLTKRRAATTFSKTRRTTARRCYSNPEPDTDRRMTGRQRTRRVEVGLRPVAPP